MKDPTVAYKERLENILGSIRGGTYGSCVNITLNLTSFSCMLELKEEVLISEVLESVFRNMRDLYIVYRIPDDVTEELESILSKLMENVIKAYDAKNTSEIFEALKEIRYTATHHQLDVWHKYPKTPSLPYGAVNK